MPHFRHPRRAPRTGLTEMRKAKFPGMQAQEFAKLIGVCRMHMTSVEVGRRDPSPELVMRWLDVLGAGARFDLFGEIPTIDRQLRALARLRATAPEQFAA